MSLKKIRFMDTSFRDEFQSVTGARVVTEDFLNFDILNNIAVTKNLQMIDNPE